LLALLIGSRSRFCFISCDAHLEVVLRVLNVKVLIVSILVGESLADEVFDCVEAFVGELSGKPVTCIVFNYLRIRFRFKQLRDGKFFTKNISLPLQVDRWEVKLRSHSLLVVLSFVAEPHVEDWTRDTNHELRHLECLLARVCR